MLDSIQIHFDQGSVGILNVLLGIMMFGASLNVKIADFSYLLKSPKAPLIGLFSQFVLLPLLTYLLTRILDVDPSLALGMILVASCPGGSFSNIMTWLARGHLATSVSMTAISTTAALVMTPLNFSFYASLNPATKALLIDIAVSPISIMLLILQVLVIPLILGMFVGNKFPAFAKKIDGGFRWFSLIVFLVFVAVAFSSNGELFMEYAHLFVGLVLLHNALALSIGFISSRLAGLSRDQTRAVTLEVGIQNSGLGLVILFSYFPHLGGMMIITAFWGVWHLVSGITLSMFWAQRPIPASTVYS